MTGIVPFASGQLPAYLRDESLKEAARALNKDVFTAAAYPTLRIKGKVFALVQDAEKKVLMNPEPGHEDETLQFIQLIVLRANPKARVYYDEAYVEGESEGVRPACSSDDGITPDATNSPRPQAAKCQVCPRAVWGTRMRDDGTTGEGTECTVNTRLAVAAPEDIDKPYLLRLPAGSRKNYSDAVKMADKRGIPYNAIVLKVGFDPTFASPKLTFKPVALLSDEAYAKAKAAYDTELIRDICGLLHREGPALPAPATPPADPADQEFDAMVAASKATAAAKATATAAVKPAPAKPAPAKPAPAKPAAAPAKPAPAPAVPATAQVDELLGDLTDLLGTPDD